MNDRLPDLEAFIAHEKPSNVSLLTSQRSKIFSGNTSRMPFSRGSFAQSQDAELSDVPVVRALAVLKALIAQYTKAISDLRALMDELATTTMPDKDRELTAKLNQLIQENNLRSRNINTSIAQLRATIDVAKGKVESATKFAIEENTYKVLVTKFKTSLSEYQSLQTEQRNNTSQKLKRQVRMINPAITQEELDIVAESGDISIVQQQLQSQVLGSHDMVKFALDDLRTKQKDIKRLEENVLQLRQIYSDINTLVSYQGEMLDQIENSVLSAKDFTDKANVDLVVVQKLQKKKKKWGFYISCCLIIVCTLCLLPILLYVGL